MHVIAVEIPELGNRAHLVHDGARALVIDPPRDCRPIELAAQRAGVADRRGRRHPRSPRLRLRRPRRSPNGTAPSTGWRPRSGCSSTASRHATATSSTSVACTCRCWPPPATRCTTSRSWSATRAPAHRARLQRRQPAPRDRGPHRPGRPAAEPDDGSRPVGERPPPRRPRRGRHAAPDPRLRWHVRGHHRRSTRPRLRPGHDRRRAQPQPGLQHAAGPLRRRARGRPRSGPVLLPSGRPAQPRRRGRALRRSRPPRSPRTTCTTRSGAAPG